MTLPANIPAHVAIIMDGNGRWAKQRGKERLHGHFEGTESVRRVIEASLRRGVRYLTLYVFSTENWDRPQGEVEGLMQLLCDSVVNEKDQLARNGVRVNIIGDREAMPERVREHMAIVEGETAGGDALVLTLALNYGAREEIAAAVRSIANEVAQGRMRPEDVTTRTVAESLYTHGLPDPDLLIRTSGEIRLSNFLLWQTAYTEFYFTETLWPDFGQEDFDRALEEYARRDRRYGRIEITNP